MENKINIAEILRDMPKGTKLYSPLFGKCNLDEVCTSDRETYPITLLTSVDASASFTKNGHYLNSFEDTECLLFPSDKMRDWSKFFKRGDIVYNPHSQMYAVFECWANDDYTEFNTTINYYKDHTFGKEEVCDTECFVKANDEQKALFIAAAEKHYGGKYNPETLQVEFAKVVEPVCPFEPFQKVLVRDSCDDKWKADYFSHYDEDNSLFPYYCVGYCYKVCIAYEGNEHLLGTDKPFNIANMAQDFSLADIKFRETGHIAYADEYITSYVSTDIVPKIYMSVNTPRDATGLVSGKPKRHYRTQYSKWVTEKTFVRQYQKIREKF